MATTASPSKRVLTEDVHNAIYASRTPHNSLISDDLAARLQNIGSRVRKCINEGYATQRTMTVSVPIPAAPFNSPVKQGTQVTQSVSEQPIFKSANETLIDVFSSPTRAASQCTAVTYAVPRIVSPTPSPKKRSRSELEHDDQDSPYMSLRNDGDDCDTGMDDMEEVETDDDGESVQFILSEKPYRPIRPLRRGSSRKFASDGSGPATPLAGVTPPTNDPYDAAGMVVDETPAISYPSSSYTDLFNQPF